MSVFITIQHVKSPYLSECVLAVKGMRDIRTGKITQFWCHMFF